ncbi:hypothetical protein BD560DRAFT_422488 [Blakeslea trispora]|nr:hypothetical protein BD560DRAFT_422488 [Blakeslea trispora]
MSMASPLFVIGSYSCLFVLIPFLLSTVQLVEIVSQIAYYLHLDHYLFKVDPMIVCLSIVTFYCYVVMGCLDDLFQTIKPSSYSFQHAYRQLRQCMSRKGKLLFYLVSCSI